MYTRGPCAWTYMCRSTRPAGRPLEQVSLAPVVPRRREDVDDHRTLVTDVHLVRNVRRNAPCPAGAEGARFVSDTERQTAAQHDSELLVVVAVLGNGASRVELDNRQRQSLAVHGARGHAVPNLPQIEFVELPERCHVATLLAGRLERLVQVGWQR